MEREEAMNDDQKARAVRDPRFLDSLKAAILAHGPHARAVWVDPEAHSFLQEPISPYPDPLDVVYAVDLVPALVDRVQDQARDIEALTALLGAARTSLEELRHPRGVHTREDVMRLNDQRDRARNTVEMMDQVFADLHFRGRVAEPERTTRRAREIHR